jgi:hypothetical protein
MKREVVFAKPWRVGANATRAVVRAEDAED